MSAELGLGAVEGQVEELLGILLGDRVDAVQEAQVLVPVDRLQVLGHRGGEVLVAVQFRVASLGQAGAEHVRDFPGRIGEDVVPQQLGAEDVNVKGSVSVGHDR
nr:hypothetical protein GCM10020093_025960 [Planobispora longispora]